ncbi:hypothetical protein RHMOL_Rhmol03G0293700 [Rhododendron molle]|uniref:Uncharacterized protein n=1 Tax=Rhododendron molle TaxID=49168 RepID=A0ACC0PK71_RHOML|nr:hypothetical protein RHMOL_Rhmol03G0293700 [Rhododendron molle]
MLRERDLTMEANMKELVERGDIQKMFEIEVDRLFWLKELKNTHGRFASLLAVHWKRDKMGQGQYCHFIRRLWGPKAKTTSF